MKQKKLFMNFNINNDKNELNIYKILSNYYDIDANNSWTNLIIKFFYIIINDKNNVIFN